MEAESETRYNIIKMRMKSRPPRAARPPRGLVRTARRRSARGFRFGRGLSRLRKCGNLDKILKKSRVRVLREKLFRFFSGRNGPDALGQATSFVCVALILLNLFVGSYVLYALELLLMAVWIFRLVFAQYGAPPRGKRPLSQAP